MSDEELDRLLRETRPPTPADDGWTSTPAGEHALLEIRRRIGVPKRPRLAHLRRRTFAGLGIGLAAATAAAVAVGLAAGPPTDRGRDIASPRNPSGVGPVPVRTALVAYTGCGAMLAQLRAHTADHVGPYGLRGIGYPYAYLDTLHGPISLGNASYAPGEKSLPAAAPAHSTTNVQEAGVGEPDIVVTDGIRIVSVSGGVLRVVNAARHEVVGRLDLGIYAGAQSAQLLLSGDHLLVLLNTEPQINYGGGIVRPVYPGYPSISGTPGTPGTTALLVDLSGGEPKVVDTLHTDGSYVDARMVDATVRLVVQSRPTITFPQIHRRATGTARTAENRRAVERAAIDAWLPSYQVTAHGRTSTRRVPCTSVSHPAHYTGESMLTVYTLPLDGHLADPQPIALAANGASVYASTTSLYVADSHYTRKHGERTQLHRFDITGVGKPRYLGSNVIPGALLDSYSMSEYAGTLRVVTTSDQYRGTANTSVFVLDENTLKIDGSVGGLGHGEQVHAVRFIGPLAYVVTFKSVDPMYVVDLHDPAHPRLAGELRVTGYSDYLHPVGDGRLLGVGQEVSGGVVRGLQVSLFDVSSPDDPQRLASVAREHTPSESPIDPHAFLYWAAEGIAVIPIDSWNYRQSGAALVVRVEGDTLAVLGTVRNPGGPSHGYDTGIERTMVIGDQLWTMSSSGLRVSGLHSLDRQAWVPFR
jgi:uncharacterized secreted protein with C-terminal beta-propeller domain